MMLIIDLSESSVPITTSYVNNYKKNNNNILNIILSQLTYMLNY